MNQKIEVRMPYSEQMPLALLTILNELKIPCEFAADNGSGVLLMSMGQEDDEELLRLWDWLTDLRVRYIEARQAAVAEQLSYLESVDAT